MPNNLPARVRRQQELVAYQRDQELDYIDHRVEVAEAQVTGINRVAQRATYETMLVGLVRREAERVAPDQAEALAAISFAAAVGTVQVIGGMYRRRWS